jgi:SAM-dependent methyltransferase
MSSSNLSARDRVEAAVKNCYSTWGESYYEDYLGPGAPYPPVHIDLLRKLVMEVAPDTVLDAGCGPASFLRHLIGLGPRLSGFDLTPEMVAEAKRVFADRGLDSEQVWQGSVLDFSAFSRPGSSGARADYDAAVCIGVLPHIAPEDEPVLFGNLFQAAKPGARVIVEARNQLFGLFTLNRPSFELFRDEFIRVDEIKSRLAQEAQSKIDDAIQEMSSGFRMDMPPIRRGKKDEAGYDEILSRTHNPFVLKQSFEAAGFRDVRTLFYHFHAMPPMLAKHEPDVFLAESLAMENPEDWRGYFMASAFLLVGSRA